MLDYLIRTWEAVFGAIGNGSRDDYYRPNPGLLDSKVIRAEDSGRYKAVKVWVINPDLSQRPTKGYNPRLKGRIAS